MIKILSNEQIRAVDAYTIRHEPIASIDLMERAAGKCHQWLKKHLKKKQYVQVFCGLGNNGGDGLALARMLARGGWDTHVVVLQHAPEASADFRINEERLQGQKKIRITRLAAGDPLPDIGREDLIIDAILGSGLTRPLEGFLARVVRHINASGAEVVSIDYPSGLLPDDNSKTDSRHVIRARHTLAFQFPKLAFLFSENEGFCGDWHLLDIGLHAEGIRQEKTPYLYLEAGDIRALGRKRSRFGHKGIYGHALLMAGSKGMTGAALLAARAASRSGCGLISAYVPASAYPIMQSAVPEALCLTDDAPDMISSVPDLLPYQAVAAGPGLGQHEQTARAMKLLIQQSRLPLLLDADALNILAENPTWLGFLPPGSILTPHPGELDRLSGKSGRGYDRLQHARELARRFQVHVVLKGAYTAICTPEGMAYFNPTGNPGMASGGSGDVLTGMILGWLAQGHGPLASCLAGVFLHGLAGDMVARRKGEEGMIAPDILDMIPMAMRKLFS